MNLLEFSAAMMTAAARVEEHLTDSMEKACVVLEDSAKEAMGDPNNGFGWPPLQQATIDRKRNGNTPLVETGELKDSIQHNSDRKEGYVGSDNPKAEWHEFGTRTIPPRPFLGGAVVAEEKKISELFGESAVKAIVG